MFIACDFCVLTFEFYVVSFPFLALCYVFLDSDLTFRRLDKKIYSEFADSRKEKKRVQRDKNENANNIFYAIFNSSFLYAISAQKSKHESHKHTTQNILFKTLCHI